MYFENVWLIRGFSREALNFRRGRHRYLGYLSFEAILRWIKVKKTHVLTYYDYEVRRLYVVTKKSSTQYGVTKF